MGKQMQKFSYEQIKDPTYFAQNRLKAHSDHKFYQNGKELVARKSALKESLQGLWKFFYTKNIKEAPVGFEAADFDCKGWDDITVPAHIQMEGYGAPQYANVQYPWDGHAEIEPGEIPEDFNPVGNYVKYLSIPQTMVGKRVFISFQGVESGFALWCNGNFVGYSEDSFTPSEFELTKYLQKGENNI